MARIKFDIQQLQAFIAIAEAGSFRAAADTLHLSAPALSRRIERLESILEQRLFERTTRRVELTGVGRQFLERARTAMDDFEAALLSITDLSAHQGGHVTVACVPSAALYFLPGVVRDFSTAYPAIRLRIMDGSMNQVIGHVMSGDADFGIGFMSTPIPEVAFEPIHTETYVVGMRRDHRLAKRRSLAWSDLQPERLIATAHGSGNRQLLDEAFSRAGVAPRYGCEVTHLSTLLGMVEAGLGLAVVPRMMLPPTHPSLVGLRLRDIVMQRQMGLLQRQRVSLRGPAAIFRKSLSDALRAKSRCD